jgi:creatinine amidohydrolase
LLEGGSRNDPSFAAGALQMEVTATKTPVLWERLTWEEVEALRRGGMDMTILPVGSTEQHGPHLSLEIDTLSALRVAHAVSAATGVPVLPPLAYGCSLGHSRRWPGTIALQPQTLIDLVVSIGDWVMGAGFRRLLLLNGHVTNFAPLRCALEILRSRFDQGMVAVLNLHEISPRVRESYFADAADWHANAAETSLMLAISPESVRADRVAAADDPDRTEGLFFSHPVNRTSANGVTGAPSRASREEGACLFRYMVDDLTARVRAALLEKPPLDHGYGAPA